MPLGQTDTDLLRQECEKLGLPVSFAAYLRHTESSRALVMEFKDQSIATLDKLVSEFCVAVGEPVPVDAIAAARRHREALERAHEQLRKHDYKGPKQIGRALATMEKALGIEWTDEDYDRADGHA